MNISISGTDFEITKVLYYKDDELEYTEDNISYTTLSDGYNTNSNTVENLYYNPDEYIGDMTIGNNTSRVDKLSLTNTYLVIRIPAGIDKIVLYSEDDSIFATIEFEDLSATVDENAYNSTGTLLNQDKYDRVLVLVISESMSNLDSVTIHETLTHSRHKYNYALYSRDSNALLSKKIFDIITNTYDTEVLNNTIVSNDFQKLYLGNRISESLLKTVPDPVKGYLYSYTSNLTGTRYYYIKSNYINSELDESALEDNPSDTDQTVSDYINNNYSASNNTKYVLSGSIGSTNLVKLLGLGTGVYSNMDLDSDSYTTYGDKILFPSQINKFEV